MHPRVLIVLLAVLFAVPALADVPQPGAAPASAAAPPASGGAFPAAAAPAAVSTTPVPPAAAAPGATSPAQRHLPGTRLPLPREVRRAKTPSPVALVSTPARDISQLEWMRGCWTGEVNKRVFTEQWTAPAAGMMLGLGHTVLDGKTESFEFMRITTDPDGKIVFVLHPGAKQEDLFLFEGSNT